MDNGFQFIDIILFAMIAGFLILRLRGMLGRRDGHEGGYSDPFRKPKAPKAPKSSEGEAEGEAENDNVVTLPGRRETTDAAPPPEDDHAAERPADPLLDGLSRIRAIDPAFSEQEFVNGGRIAFEMILGAYVSGDTRTLKNLLSPEVYGNFQRAITEREKAGETLEETLVGIKTAEIVEAYMEGRYANVTVKFVSEQINAVYDANGDVVDGDPEMVATVTDYWTFARDTRSRDPNWMLVATRSQE